LVDLKPKLEVAIATAIVARKHAVPLRRRRDGHGQFESVRSNNHFGIIAPDNPTGVIVSKQEGAPLGVFCQLHT
jgi:hypothetical protein